MGLPEGGGPLGRTPVGRSPLGRGGGLPDALGGLAPEGRAPAGGVPDGGAPLGRVPVGLGGRELLSAATALSASEGRAEGIPLGWPL